jgi:hypothetical protein
MDDLFPDRFKHICPLVVAATRLLDAARCVGFGDAEIRRPAMGTSGILAHPATRKRFILPRIVVRSKSIGRPHTGNNRQGAAVASAAHAHLASRGVTPAPSRPVRRRAINPGLHFSESTAWLSPVSNRIIKRRPYPTNQHRPPQFSDHSRRRSM